MKILIISHNPTSSYQNMGKTFLSLFHDFVEEELCQLYIYPSVPDIERCESYYRVTDKEALKSCFGMRNIGREIKSDEIKSATKSLFTDKRDEALYRNPKNKKPFRMLLRDDVWRFSHWYNKNLRRWIEKEQPTCIFIAPGTGKFLYNIAIKLSKKYKLPIVSYLCDDYYFLKPHCGFWGRKYSKLFKHKIEELFSITSCFIAINKEIARVYSEKFHLPSITIMTGSNYPIRQDIKKDDNVTSITYMGNIRCNRFYSLVEIGEKLDEINAEYGTNYELNIYTAEKDGEILETLSKCLSIKLKGFVSGEEFDKIFHSASMLLHVEAFDEKSIDLVKYSISTKIADSLGSGICLFAYGPSSVASMQHLIDNDCAICATSRDELKAKLLLAFNNKEERERVARNGLVAAHNFHDSELNSKILYDNLKRVSESVIGESFTGK